MCCRQIEACWMLRSYPWRKQLQLRYTVPLEIFLHMKRIRTYEEMLADNELTQFEEHMGKAMFISHQWLLLPNWHVLASCRQRGSWTIVMVRPIGHLVRKRAKWHFSFCVWPLFGPRGGYSKSRVSKTLSSSRTTGFG